MVLEKTKISEDTYLVGLGVSPGISIGETFLVNRAPTSVVPNDIESEEVEAEIDRFREALKASEHQLREIKQRVASPELRDHIYIIDTHLLILNDQMLINDTVRAIEHDLVGAETALQRTLKSFRAVFDSIEDEYLRERGSDIEAVGERVLRNLVGEQQHSLNEIDRQAIIVAHDLSPADTMVMDREKVTAFITDVGGRTSHTAILARSLGIPAVVGLETATGLIPDGVPVIVDGEAGTVILNPSPETFKEYLGKKQEYEYQEKELLALRDLEAVTTDGVRLALKGNIELLDEVQAALRHGAEGIGLFRTEFMFINRQVPPDEEEQVAVYRDIVDRMAPNPVTIRTLDVGGDKFIPEINLADEANPAMGLRAVRFSLKEKRLFKAQLRAILRTSAFGRVRVMFPMISGVAEIRECKLLLEEAKAELRKAGIAFDPHLAAGIMMETPSAAVIADLLAREVDFFSVGTNDLIQYFLAVDRGNEHVAYLYEPLHPAILRALKMICDAGRSAGIPVAMCGEMASDPLYALVLLGLGFDELSMNPACISRVKRLLRQLEKADGERMLAELLDLSTAGEVAQRIEKEMARRFPNLFRPPVL